MIRVQSALVRPFLFGLFSLAAGCGSPDDSVDTSSGGSSSGGSGPGGGSGGNGGATVSGGASSGGNSSGGSGTAGSSNGGSTNGGASSGGSSDGGASSGGSSDGGASSGGSGPSGGGDWPYPDPVGDVITDLPVGTWTDVTPDGSLGATGVYHLGVAPGQPEIVYLASDKEGMYKSTDASKTWVRLGSPDGYNTNGTTDYLEDPCNIRVDPLNPDHVYATEGVDGGRDGFWISTDGGDTWAIPQGFKDVGAIVGGGWADVVEMSVSPVDFNHVIISPHSDWEITTGYSSGIFETTDGGVTFTHHLPPNDQWAAGSKGVHILHHPESGTGNDATWIVCDEGSGIWRTTNSGGDWDNVKNEAKGPHGGNQGYYTPEGVFYVGAVYHPWRTTDNGATWDEVDTLNSTTYRSIFGANGMLFAHNVGEDGNFYTSAEDDGDTWASDADDHGLTSGGTWEMGWDPVNQLLYAVNKSGGLWALRMAE